MSDSGVTGPFDGDRPRTSRALIAAEQSKAVTEVQAALVVARTRPRDVAAVRARILSDCERIKLAEVAVYEYPRSKTVISGPSIRLAETIAKRWGNMEAGIKELSRADGVSECMAYAWDYETNYRDVRAFTVRHWRDTRSGGYPVHEERDIYELVANAGARRKRACIIAVVDSEVLEDAVSACEATVIKDAKIDEKTVPKMVERFAEFNVTPAQIQKRLGVTLSQLTPRMVLSLRRIYASLNDGITAPSEWFDMPSSDPGADVAGSSGTAAVKSRLRRTRKKSDGSKPGADSSAPAEDDATLTYATVADAITGAKDTTAANAASGLIKRVRDPKQRAELEQMYSRRMGELEDGGQP